MRWSTIYCKKYGSKISRINNHVGNHQIILSEKFNKNFKKKLQLILFIIMVLKNFLITSNL